MKKQADGNGVLLLAGIEHLAIIKNWVYLFCEEVDMAVSSEEAEVKAMELINQKKIFILEKEGRIVSMAAATRPTKNNITVNFVFTPMNERKKGFASNCVSSLSALLLAKGYQTTSLYTDLANPTSNKIYMEIGYEPVMDSIVIHFNK